MKVNRLLNTLHALLALSLTLTLPAQVLDTVTLEPSRDTTIYSDGEKSNGQGSYIFAGETRSGNLRRGLLAFDLTALPQNALVQEASLTLNMNKTIVGSQEVSLHRLIGDWGEGASDAPDNEGSGTSAETGDATWTVRFAPDFPWLTEGGDFIETASATTSVDGIGAYTWEGDGLVADVQAWIDDPSLNVGWILIGNEGDQSAKRFDSRHADEASVRPTLSISYLVREEVQNWAGYEVSDDGSSVNTAGFLGWIDISQAPWIYSYSLGTFIYLPESGVSPAGGWAYVPR
jgi:hypothetical protein